MTHAPIRRAASIIGAVAVFAALAGIPGTRAHAQEAERPLRVYGNTTTIELAPVEKRRTWVKLSAAYRLTWAQLGQTRRDPRANEMALRLAPRLLEHAGPERLVWGSDCPFVGHEAAVSYRDTLDDLAAWVPDPLTCRKISATALKPWCRATSPPSTTEAARRRRSADSSCDCRPLAHRAAARLRGRPANGLSCRP